MHLLPLFHARNSGNIRQLLSVAPLCEEYNLYLDYKKAPWVCNDTIFCILVMGPLRND